MRRITAEEVQAAYAKTGLHPRQGLFFRYYDLPAHAIIPAWDGKTKLRGAACALGVVAITESITGTFDLRFGENNYKTLMEYLGLDADYMNAFVYVFDGYPYYTNSEAGRAGVEDGRRTREMVLGTQECPGGAIG